MTTATLNALAVRELFNELPDRLCADKARTLVYNWHIQLVGKVPACYTIEVVRGSCAVREQLIGKPDCVMITDATVFSTLCRGDSSIEIASMIGEVKTDTLAGAAKFQRLFSTQT